MSINPHQFMQTFIAEAHELLQEMEEILLLLENGSQDHDSVDALFRVAHTVKGSAGMFDLEPIVDFAHVVEDVLDHLRDGGIEIGGELVEVLLESCDHMRQLVGVIAGQGGELDEAALARDSKLRGRLHACQQLAAAAGQMETETGVTVAAEQDIPLTSSGGEVSSDNWHISLRFAPDVLKEGLEPLYMIRYLANIGRVVSITTIADALPEAADMDPEACYLGFEIDLNSDANKETIAEVFEFAHQGNLIHILAPHSKTIEYVKLIRTLPEDDARLGEILVAASTITQQSSMTA